MIYFKTVDDVWDTVKFSTFSDGTKSLFIGKNDYVDNSGLIPRFEPLNVWYPKQFVVDGTSIDLQEFLLFIDYVSNKTVDVFIYYLPFARLDKINDREPTILHQIINSLGLSDANFVINDPHGYYGEVERYVRPLPNNTTIVFPDQGAQKRYGQFYPNKDGYIVLTKKRYSVSSAESYVSHEVDSNLKEKLESSFEKVGNSNITIVDDICDGGATFMSAADKIADVLGYYPNFHLNVTYLLNPQVFDKMKLFNSIQYQELNLDSPNYLRQSIISR